MLFWVTIGICFPIEVIKQIEEEQWLRKGDPEPELWITLLEHYHDETIEAEHKKLAQLHLGDIPFPPQVFSNSGSKGRQKIIGIHNKMYKSVH